VNRRTRRNGAALAGLALAGTVLVTACSPQQIGAAAVVDGQRLSVSTLQQNTKSLEQADTAEALPPGEAQRVTLSRFIVSGVIEAAAKSKGVSVTQGEIDAQRREIEQVFGGREQMIQQLAAQNVPPLYIDTFIHDVALSDALGRALVPGDDQAVGQERSAALNDLLLATAKDLDVKVNPRYGVWNAQQGVVEGQISGGLAHAAQDYRAPQGNSPENAPNPEQSPRP
jgi:hypothetical protein